MSIQETLSELIDPARPLRLGRLTELTELNPEETSALGEAWPRISMERRRELVRNLTELAEDNVDLNFDAVFFTALNDEDAEVRISAVQGLWEYDDRDLIDPLITLLHDDGDGGVRSAAASALGKYVMLAELERVRPADKDRVVGALRSVIGSRTNDLEVRARALESLGAHSEPWVHDVVRAAYDTGNHRMMVSALHAMGRSCDPIWLPTLIEELADDDPEVRYEAALACGEIGEEEAVSGLVLLLQDEDPEVQEAAIDALGKIGGQRAQVELKALLGDPSERVREVVRVALAAIEFAESSLYLSEFDEFTDGSRG